MADTTFSQGIPISSEWLNEINDFYHTLFAASTTASAARTALGLGTISTQAAASVTITGGSITGITDLAVADGGTGSSTAGAARTALGAAASGANTDITSLNAPALGAATATTQSAGDNSTRVATTAYADAAAAATTVVPTGALSAYVGTTAPAGWVLASGLTMGNGASGGTGRANADTETLFTLLWNSMADAQAAVSGGRGASAAADYAANKTIVIPDLRGRAIFGKDDMGGSAASRLTNGNSGVTGSTLGYTGGDERIAGHTHTGPSHTHTFTTGAESGHTHSAGSYSVAVSVGAADCATPGAQTPADVGATAVTGTSGASSGHTHGGTSDAGGTGATGSTGAGSSANIPPAFVLNFIIKL